jgi:gamma-glutamyl-gamma-aminobutyrate hydrolase PuuD
VQAVQNAGGAISVIPPLGDIPFTDLLSRFDGLLLHGGIDLSPMTYGESAHPKVTSWDDTLDAFEFGMLKAALELDKPVLAICRGMQVLNVLQGGSLIQHIPDERQSDIEHWSTDHEIVLKPDSILFSAIGIPKINAVSSYHHQAVKNLGRGLRAVAWSHDEIVEAVEHTSATWVVGVQWHPEDKPHAIDTEGLFRAFVRACIRDEASATR